MSNFVGPRVPTQVQAEASVLGLALDDEYEDSLESGAGVSFYRGNPNSFNLQGSFSPSDLYLNTDLPSYMTEGFRTRQFSPTSPDAGSSPAISGISVPMGAAIGRGGERAPWGSQSRSLLPRQGSSARKSLDLDLSKQQLQQFEDLFLSDDA